MGTLDGKIAVVTGAASGIGRASARLMAAEGARVVVADRNGPGAVAVADEIADEGGFAVGIRADVTIEAEVRAMIEAAVDTWGGLDVLHNNAGTTDVADVGADTDITQMTIELWDHMMAVNLRGPMLGCKHAIPHMIARGGGSIVMTSSMSAFAGDLRYAAYGASKGGLNSFTKYVATMYGKQRIRANAVCPGLVVTPAAREHFDPAMLALYEGNHLTPELGTPEQVAAVAVFLASDAAAYVTGQAIPVDGGLYSHLPTFAQMRALEG
jgi:NAD(P)-dependent dehydrogenase (short-subunit alcohol dehydrogenase family)